MWPKWLAETLDRSSIDPRPRAEAKRQHVPDADAFRAGGVRADGGTTGARATDWELATGFRIHLGYGRAQSAEFAAAEADSVDSEA